MTVRFSPSRTGARTSARSESPRRSARSLSPPRTRYSSTGTPSAAPRARTRGRDEAPERSGGTPSITRPAASTRSSAEITGRPRAKIFRPASEAGRTVTKAGSSRDKIRPASMIRMLSAMPRAKDAWWVTTIMVRPPPRRPRMMSRTSLTLEGSRDEEGSSKSISFGRMASMRAMAPRCLWPPESCPG